MNKAEHILEFDKIKELWMTFTLMDAATTLFNIRNWLLTEHEKMREKANWIMRVNKNYMADFFSTMRNGHICLLVKRNTIIK